MTTESTVPLLDTQLPFSVADVRFANKEEKRKDEQQQQQQRRQETRDIEASAFKNGANVSTNNAE